MQDEPATRATVEVASDPSTAAPVHANGCWMPLSLALFVALSLSVLRQPDFMHQPEFIRRGLLRFRPEHGAEAEGGRMMVFYHVHAENNWREILMDQCTKLVYSGLYEAATAVNVGVSGPTEQAVSEASSFLTNFGSKFNITATGVRTSLFERLTLICVKGLTLPTDRIFYFHSKGVTARHQEPGARARIWAWRDSMEFFLVHHHRQCLRLLRDYDLLGINWIKAGDSFPLDDGFSRSLPGMVWPSHFSGNFWWASAAFWHTLPDGFIGDTYNEPELAMFRYSPRAACVHYDGLEGFGHYHHWLPPKNYTDIATVSVVRHS